MTYWLGPITVGWFLRAALDYATDNSSSGMRAVSIVFCLAMAAYGAYIWQREAE